MWTIVLAKGRLWGSNPRPFGLAPGASALDLSAKPSMIAWNLSMQFGAQRNGMQKGGVTPLLLSRGNFQSMQASCPSTADSTQFRLLCCQPEPFPGLLSVRSHLLTLMQPYRLSAWLRADHCDREREHALVHGVSSPPLSGKEVTLPFWCYNIKTFCDYECAQCDAHAGSLREFIRRRHKYFMHSISGPKVPRSQCETPHTNRIKNEYSSQLAHATSTKLKK